MIRLRCVIGVSLGAVSLAGLLLCGAGTTPAITRAAAPRATARLAAAGSPNVTGVWAFATNDAGDNLSHFTLHLQQQGTRVIGFAGHGEPVAGSVTGSTFSFTVYGVSSEDDYGGQGTIGPSGRLMEGSFWDGYGFAGVFGAVKLTTG